MSLKIDILTTQISHHVYFVKELINYFSELKKQDLLCCLAIINSYRN